MQPFLIPWIQSIINSCLDITHDILLVLTVHTTFPPGQFKGWFAASVFNFQLFAEPRAASVKPTKALLR